MVAATLQWSYCVRAVIFGIRFWKTLAINLRQLFLQITDHRLRVRVWNRWWFGLKSSVMTSSTLIDRQRSDETCSS